MPTVGVARTVQLRSGHRVVLRPLRPTDRAGLAHAFAQLSETSRYRRFFTASPRLSEETLALLLDVDHVDHEALVAVAARTGELVGVARFVRDRTEPDTAEVAVTVVDAWQNRGLGTVLLDTLSRRATQVGIRHFTAEILAENRPMLTLARQLGEVRTERSGATVAARIDLAERPDKAHALILALLRAASRGEMISVPVPMRGWLDASEKIARTLRIPVSCLLDATGRHQSGSRPPSAGG